MDEREDLLLELPGRSGCLSQLKAPLRKSDGNSVTDHARDAKTVDLTRRSLLNLDHLEIPKLDVLVGATTDEALLIGPNLERPNGTRVSLDLRDECRGRDVVKR